LLIVIVVMTPNSIRLNIDSNHKMIEGVVEGSGDEDDEDKEGGKGKGKGKGKEVEEEGYVIVDCEGVGTKELILPLSDDIVLQSDHLDGV
jgi:hypothetical protein